MKKSLFAVVACVLCASLAHANPSMSLEKAIAKAVNAKMPRGDMKISAASVKPALLNGAIGGFTAHTRTNRGAFPQLVAGSFSEKAGKLKITHLSFSADGKPGVEY